MLDSPNAQHNRVMPDGMWSIINEPNPPPESMSGIGGGVVTGSSLQDLVVALDGRSEEKTWRFESGEAGFAVSHPLADPEGITVWDRGTKAGIVYGAITNLDELGWDEKMLFERLFSRPTATAAVIEGAFLIAGYNGQADQHLVVTDKLGARSCFYTETEPFRFATAVGGLLPHIADPSLDLQAVSDLLLMGYLWGERTLVEEIRTLRPATVLEVIDGDRSTTRYWKPNYEPRERGDAYFDELASRYRQAARRTASTIPSEAGIWLSGGLDSRTTAAALLEQAPPDGLETLRAYGYDANPPTNDNPRIANEVARALDIEYVQVPLSAETFADDLERVIEVTDGMLRWNTTANLSPSYHVDREMPVLMEGAQGELIGDHLLRYHLDDSRSVVQAQYASEASTSANMVQQLLTEEVDPLATFEQEAARTSETTHRGKVLDIHFQNYYARLGLASNRLMRDRGGSRTMQVDGDYLEWCARIPRDYRKGTFPYSEHVFKSDAGGVPYGTSRAKLELCRRICPELADIIYERTKVKPSQPYPLHIMGFVTNVLVNRLRSKATYANGQLQDFWIRDTDTHVYARVTELVDDACARSLFDSDTVRTIYDNHMEGANNASLLAQITTLEHWLQTYFD